MSRLRRPELPEEARGVLRVLATVRIYALTFSVPYVWLWTAALPTPQRVAATATHAFALLACCTATEAIDGSRGLQRHLALGRDPRWTTQPLARILTAVFAAACLLAALPLVALHPLATLAVAVALAVGLLATRLPAGWKYLIVPELLVPLGFVVLPALALELVAGIAVDRLTVVAGTAFLAALILACHLRDAEFDLAHDVPTLATRRPGTARWWLWVTAITGALTAVAELYVPLADWEALAVLGAGGFLACVGLPARTTRVPALTIAHALFALSLLMR